MFSFLVCKRKTVTASHNHRTLTNLEPSDIWETLHLALMRAYWCSAYVNGNYLCHAHLPIGSWPYEDTNPTTFSRILSLFHLIKGVTCVISWLMFFVGSVRLVHWSLGSRKPEWWRKVRWSVCCPGFCPVTSSWPPYCNEGYRCSKKISLMGFSLFFNFCLSLVLWSLLLMLALTQCSHSYFTHYDFHRHILKTNNFYKNPL